MKPKKAIINVVTFLLLATVLNFLFTWPIQLLWNHALVDAIDGINPISFWQALGIGMLVSLLMGNKSKSSKND
jgi:hypothetical protein